MPKPPGSIDRFRLFKGLELSLAGARTGSALIADKALNTLIKSREHSPLLEKEARRFVAKLGKMKGTYVKAGQMLALVGEYVLPVELTEALHTLESATPPLPESEVRRILASQLGSKLNELRIDDSAIGVASLAQVHKAERLSDQTKLALKFLYPGIRESIDQDFRTVTRMLNLTRWLKVSRGFDQWMEQIREQLLLEVDYQHEIAMTELFARALAEDDRYRVPRIHHEFCAPDLIAMDYIRGVAVTDVQVSVLPQDSRNRLAIAMLDLFFKEVFSLHQIQADPNFGNYRINLDSPQPSLVLLDFGSVINPGELFFTALQRAIAAAQVRDRSELIAALITLGCLTEDSSQPAQDLFADFCIEIMEPLRPKDSLPKDLLNAQGQYCWSQSGLVKRAAKMAARSLGNRSFDLPSEQFALVSRKLVGVFTFITTLRAEFNGADVLAAYLNPSPSLENSKDEHHDGIG